MVSKETRTCSSWHLRLLASSHVEKRDGGQIVRTARLFFQTRRLPNLSQSFSKLMIAQARFQTKGQRNVSNRSGFAQAPFQTTRQRNLHVTPYFIMPKIRAGPKAPCTYNKPRNNLRSRRHTWCSKILPSKHNYACTASLQKIKKVLMSSSARLESLMQPTIPGVISLAHKCIDPNIQESLSESPKQHTDDLGVWNSSRRRQ